MLLGSNQILKIPVLYCYEELQHKDDTKYECQKIQPLSKILMCGSCWITDRKLYRTLTCDSPKTLSFDPEISAEHI